MINFNFFDTWRNQKSPPRPSLEELIPDKTRREEILSRLYKDDPLLGGDGIMDYILEVST
jgi:hypothetical protein